MEDERTNREDKVRQAALLMLKADRLHRQLFDRAGEPFGLCRTHHIILMRLSCCEKIPTQKEIAESLGITPAAATGALKKLEEEGYLSRTAGQDSRKNEIAITEYGRETVRRTHEVFSALDASLFADFSPEELSAYEHLLGKLCVGMENYLREGEKTNVKETGRP